MNHKKDNPGRINPYRWMTTYTDLVTLLLTFFVLLLSMAVITDQKRIEAMSSVMGAFGFKHGGQSVLGSTSGTNVTANSAPIKEEDVEMEVLKNIELKNSLHADMSVVREEERIIISLSNRLLFKPRSSVIEPNRIGLLSELKEVFKKSPSRIELRGYADPSETIFDPNRFRPAMMLSTKRAFAIFQFMLDGGEIPPARMVAHGFGHTPSSTGAPKDVHLQNRQVQIILDYRERLPYHLSKPAPNSFLDFKGFFFKLYGGKDGE
jgi:chemotaxis protein MotB